VIDRNVSEVEAIEAAGYDAIFGDVKYETVRKEAGLKYADFVFSSSAQTDINHILLEETNDDATVFVEAECPDDAIDLYEKGADFVVMAPQLSADQLKRYFEVYLTQPEAFESVLAADLEILRSSELFPALRSVRGEIDD